MGKKAVVEKPRLEQHYDNVMSKITAWEQERSSGSRIVPWILLILGAFVTTLGIFYGIFRGSFTIGMIIVNHWHPDDYYSVAIIKTTFKRSKEHRR